MRNDETQRQMEKIHLLSRKKLTAEEVYIFPLSLCDNEVDRDNERFTLSALQTLAGLFVGKTGLFDHSMQSKDQTARIFDTSVERDPSRRNAVGEEYHYLKGWAYLLRNDKNAPLIDEIEGGIKKEVSVGCRVSARLCSVCGGEKGSCTHRPGQYYDGKLCHTLLDDPTDAYEWSFVAVPAQPSAGVVKSWSPSPTPLTFPEQEDLTDLLKQLHTAESQVTLSIRQTKELSDYLTSLRQSAREAEEYRRQLSADVLRLSAGGSFSADFIAKGMSLLSLEELKELKTALAKEHAGGGSQLYAAVSPSEGDNRQFQI